MTFGNAAIRHGLSLIVFLKWINYNNTQYMHTYIYIYTFASPVKCVFEPSKENKSKTINARKNKDSFGICIKFRTKLRIPIFVLFF